MIIKSHLYIILIYKTVLKISTHQTGGNKVLFVVMVNVNVNCLCIMLIYIVYNVIIIINMKRKYFKNSKT